MRLLVGPSIWEILEEAKRAETYCQISQRFFALLDLGFFCTVASIVTLREGEPICGANASRPRVCFHCTLSQETRQGLHIGSCIF